jgi:hypothetical protein
MVSAVLSAEGVGEGRHHGPSSVFVRDAVVTCFFLDTAPVVLEYFDVMYVRGVCLCVVGVGGRRGCGVRPFGSFCGCE